MDKLEFIKNMQELAQSVTPLELTNHCLNCSACASLLIEAQRKLLFHLNQTRGSN